MSDFTVTLISDDYKTMEFTSHDKAKVIILSASESIVDTVFPGLRLIYCQNPIAISITQIIGILITNQQSSCSMIGSVLPISLLPILCVDAIRTKTLQLFFEVCSCIIPGFHSCTVDLAQPNQHRRLPQSKSSYSTQVPIDRMWCFLILSEVLECNLVFKELSSRLYKIIFNSNLDDRTKAGLCDFCNSFELKNSRRLIHRVTESKGLCTCLPIMSSSQIPAEMRSSVVQRIRKHFQLYGPEPINDQSVDSNLIDEKRSNSNSIESLSTKEHYSSAINLTEKCARKLDQNFEIDVTEKRGGQDQNNNLSFECSPGPPEPHPYPLLDITNQTNRAYDNIHNYQQQWNYHQNEEADQPQPQKKVQQQYREIQQQKKQNFRSDQINCNIEEEGIMIEQTPLSKSVSSYFNPLESVFKSEEKNTSSSNTSELIEALAPYLNQTKMNRSSISTDLGSSSPTYNLHGHYIGPIKSTMQNSTQQSSSSSHTILSNTSIRNSVSMSESQLFTSRIHAKKRSNEFRKIQIQKKIDGNIASQIKRDNMKAVQLRACIARWSHRIDSDGYSDHTNNEKENSYKKHHSNNLSQNVKLERSEENSESLKLAEKARQRAAERVRQNSTQYEEEKHREELEIRRRNHVMWQERDRKVAKFRMQKLSGSAVGQDSFQYEEEKHKEELEMRRRNQLMWEEKDRRVANFRMLRLSVSASNDQNKKKSYDNISLSGEPFRTLENQNSDSRQVRENQPPENYEENNYKRMPENEVDQKCTSYLHTIDLNTSEYQDSEDIEDVENQPKNEENNYEQELEVDHGHTSFEHIRDLKISEYQYSEDMEDVENQPEIEENNYEQEEENEGDQDFTSYEQLVDASFCGSKWIENEAAISISEDEGGGGIQEEEGGVKCYDQCYDQLIVERDVEPRGRVRGVKGGVNCYAKSIAERDASVVQKMIEDLLGL